MLRPERQAFQCAENSFLHKIDFIVGSGPNSRANEFPVETEFNVAFKQCKVTGFA
jgi:hypothetical protein